VAETLQPLLVSDADAARLCGVCRSTFRKMLRSGRIDVPCVKMGRRRLYSVEALRAFVAGGCRPNVGRGGGRE